MPLPPASAGAPAFRAARWKVNTEASKSASLLKWADGCNMSIQPVSDIKDAYTQWFDSLSADDQQSFADAWPLIKADAETLLTDKDSMTGRIEDAGLDAKELPGCSEENWKALADVIDVLVPASSEY